MASNTPDNNVISVSRDDAQLLHWLRAARAGRKEARSRPILEGIAVDKKYCVSADGYRLHAAPTPECLQPFTGAVAIVDVPASGGLAAPVIIDKLDRYPSVKCLVPRRKPLATFYISPRLLSDALRGMSDEGSGALIRVHASRKSPGIIEVLGYSPTGQALYALIMPRIRAESGYIWRPEYPLEQHQLQRKLVLLAEAERTDDEYGYGLLLDADPLLLNDLYNAHMEALEQPETERLFTPVELKPYAPTWYNARQLRDLADGLPVIVSAGELPALSVAAQYITTTCRVTRHGAEFIGTTASGKHIHTHAIAPWRLRELLTIARSG